MRTRTIRENGKQRCILNKRFLSEAVAEICEIGEVRPQIVFTKSSRKLPVESHNMKQLFLCSLLYKRPSV